MNRTIRMMVAEREMTVQEAALDALSLPLIEFSCQAVYVQVKRPSDTTHMLRPHAHWAKKKKEEGHVEWKDITYDAPVCKYIKRKW